MACDALHIPRGLYVQLLEWQYASVPTFISPTLAAVLIAARIGPSQAIAAPRPRQRTVLDTPRGPAQPQHQFLTTNYSTDAQCACMWRQHAACSVQLPRGAAHSTARHPFNTSLVVSLHRTGIPNTVDAVRLQPHTPLSWGGGLGRDLGDGLHEVLLGHGADDGV